MKKRVINRISNDIHLKKTGFALLGFILFVIIVAFLNFQMDDERYFGLYDYTAIPDQADFEGGVINIDESMGLVKGDIIAEIPAMHVDAGSFLLDVDHQGNEDFDAVVYDGNTELFRYTLPKDSLNSRLSFSSNDNLYNLRIVYQYGGKGRNTVKRTILYSVGKPFYYDTALFSVLIIVAAIFVFFVLVRYDFFILSASEKLFLGGIIVFLIFINYPYFRPFPIWEGDISYHVARIEGIYRGWTGGQFPVFFYPDASRGRGMIGALYPHLFLAIPAMLRVLHISPEAAMRVWMIMINLATATSAYYSSKILTVNRRLSSVAMMLYMLLPYRLTTMTWRCAYGEALAMIFIPLVIAGLYEIIDGNRKNWPILALGISGIIESHIMSTIQIAIVCISIGLVFFVRLIRTKRIVQVLYAICAVLLLNLWYIVPFLYYYTSDIDLNANQPSEDLSYISYFISQMMQLFPNVNISFQMHHQIVTIGIWLLILAILAVYMHLRENNNSTIGLFSVIIMVIGFVFLFAATKTFPWQTLGKFQLIYEFMGKFEFSLRFLMMGESLIFFASILVYANTGGITYRRAIWVILLSIALFQGYLISDNNPAIRESFIDAREYRFQPDTADGIKYDFYAPEGYDYERFNDEFTTPSAQITDYRHFNRHTEFKYISGDDTYVEIPLVFYKGYRAYIRDTHEVLDVSKGNMGCLRIDLPQTSQEQTIIIDYIGEPVWKVLVIVSVFSLIALIVIMCHGSERSNQLWIES